MTTTFGMSITEATGLWCVLPFVSKQERQYPVNAQGKLCKSHRGTVQL